MVRKNIYALWAVLFVAFLFACGGKKEQKDYTPKEDKTAKQMLQGIWINADDESVAFKVHGDTIFYPDTTSSPVYFQIIHDTLVMRGSDVEKYPIVKQSAHRFVFKNQNGETVTLELSDNPIDKYEFQNKGIRVLNQNQLITRDTVVTYDKRRYHCYVQINPTTFKVLRSTYNDEGVEVDNVYHDNIINLSVFLGKEKLFSKDFKKKDFNGIVPKEFLSQAILNDMTFQQIDARGIHYDTFIGVPDSPSSYVVEVIVSPEGKLKMQLGS